MIVSLFVTIYRCDKDTDMRQEIDNYLATYAQVIFVIRNSPARMVSSWMNPFVQTNAHYILLITSHWPREIEIRHNKR